MNDSSHCVFTFGMTYVGGHWIQICRGGFGSLEWYEEHQIPSQESDAAIFQLADCRESEIYDPFMHEVFFFFLFV